MDKRSKKRRSKAMESSKKGNVSLAVTPWKTLEERSWVIDKLYNGNLQERKEALRQMDLWKVRSRARDHLGIEVTTILARAQLFQEKLILEEELTGVASVEDEPIQLMYSTAIIRFVNLITECRQDMDYPIPIHSIAQKMGIPEWIVDLRHSASHSKMPSLELFESAATWAFEWLRLNYWEKETTVCSSFQPSSPPEEQKDNLTELFFEIGQNLSAIKGRKKSPEVMKTKTDTLNHAQKLIDSNDSLDVVTALLSDGLFFPTFQDILASSSAQSNMLGSKEMKMWMMTWLPVIKIIALTDGILFMLQELFEMATHEGIKAKYATEWIGFILSWLKQKDSLDYGDHSQFCLLIVQSITPSTIVYLPVLLEIFGKTIPPAGIKNLTALAERIAPWNGHEKLWKLFDDYMESDECVNAEEDPEESSWQKYYALGVCPSQSESKETSTGNLTLPDFVNKVPKPPEELDDKPPDSLVFQDTEISDSDYTNISLL